MILLDPLCILTSFPTTKLLLLLLLEKFCCADFAKADALKKGVSANLRLYDHNQKGGEPTKKLSVDRPEEDDDDDEAIEE